MAWLRPCRAPAHNSGLGGAGTALNTATIKFSTKPTICSSETCFIQRGVDTRRYFLILNWKQSKKKSGRNGPSLGLQGSKPQSHPCVGGQTERWNVQGYFRAPYFPLYVTEATAVNWGPGQFVCIPYLLIRLWTTLLKPWIFSVRGRKCYFFLKGYDSCYSVLKGHILWQKEKKILEMKVSSAGNQLATVSDIINFFF